MNPHIKHFLIPGPAGNIQCAMTLPDPEQHGAPRGLALVAHPHPLFGGTMDNKVAQTLARSLTGCGYAAVRMNFRGVGQSEGVHDAGIGETDDMACLLDFMRTDYPDLPLVLAGFSFGTFVQSRLQQRLAAAGQAGARLILVGAAAGKWAMPEIPAESLLIHGEQDDTIPLAAVLDWLRPQNIPVTVVPGADHFFHGRLNHIKTLVQQFIRQP